MEVCFHKILWVVLCLSSLYIQAQEFVYVDFRILDSETLEPISEAFVMGNSPVTTLQATKNGKIHLRVSTNSQMELVVKHSLYIEKKINVTVLEIDLLLEDVLLEQSPFQKMLEERLEAQIALDRDVLETYLDAQKDLLWNKAAFDWGSSFFKLRGMDRTQEVVYINGIPQNSLLDGSVSWNQWGGLNDFTRSLTESIFLKPHVWAATALNGHSKLQISPWVQRGGLKTTLSSSNQSYQSRAMISYVAKKNPRLQFGVGASFRGAERGYKAGTPYEAFSSIFSGTKKWNENAKTTLNAIYTNQIRGKSAPLTQEVANLLGTDYNPYWGRQNHQLRNSRVKKGTYITLNAAHDVEKDKGHLYLGVQLLRALKSQSRIGYFNAPNPDPIYYRNLASYYINSPIGANFYSANEAVVSLLEQPQIPWEELYNANQNTLEGAAYLLLDDVEKEERQTASARWEFALNPQFSLDLYGSYTHSTHEFYSLAADLLGGTYVVDVDPFSQTNNDVEGNLLKLEGDPMGYRYQLNLYKKEAHMALQGVFRHWSTTLGYGREIEDAFREGLFQNERYPSHSKGKSEPLHFNTQNAHLGVQIAMNPRNYLEVNSAWVEKAPLAVHSFINPREHNGVVPNLVAEKWKAAEFNYIARWIRLQSKTSVFYFENWEATQLSYYFVHSGLGSAFIQEVSTQMGRVNKGIETSLSYELTPSWNLTAVASMGNYTFKGNPHLSIYFDPNSNQGKAINTEGVADLGAVELDGFHSDSGPERALSIALSYRDPKYWWVSLSFNRLSNNYLSLSKIKRTVSFFRDPETLEMLPISEKERAKLYRQKPLEPYYLTHLLAGKSWLKNGKYTALFLSVSNLLDVSFQSGGFEQSRLGNYADYTQNHRSNQPSFGPKYWWSNGRTYYLNLTFSIP